MGSDLAGERDTQPFVSLICRPLCDRTRMYGRDYIDRTRILDIACSMIGSYD